MQVVKSVISLEQGVYTVDDSIDGFEMCYMSDPKT